MKRKNVDPAALVITGLNPRDGLNDKTIRASMMKRQLDGERPFDDAFPIVCNETEDGTLELLQGHRRTSAAIAMKLDKIPAIVHSNLSEFQKLELILDHSSERDRMALNRWEQYRAYAALYACQAYETEAYYDALTEQEYKGNFARCAKLGIRKGKGSDPYKVSHNIGQAFERIYRMRDTDCGDGKTIAQHYKTLETEGKDKTWFRTTQIANLEKLHKENRDKFLDECRSLETAWKSGASSLPRKAMKADDADNLAALLPEPLAAVARLVSGKDTADEKSKTECVARATDYARDADVGQWFRLNEPEWYHRAMSKMAE
jgi:hypothetical protein